MNRLGILAGLIALLVCAAQPTIARAEFGVTPGSEEIQSLDAEGRPEMRAGAHPDRFLIKFNLNTLGEEELASEKYLEPDGGNLREVTLDLPPGLIGDPSGVPACPLKTFYAVMAEEECQESQVGEFGLKIPTALLKLPVYSLEPAPDELAVLGASSFFVQPKISMELRPDNGTTMRISGLSQAIPVLAIEIELWGVPADHQSEQVAPRRPYLTLPSHCGEPLGLLLSVNSWQAPNVVQTVHMETDSDLDSCDSQPFGPAISFAMAGSTADTPSGAQIDIAHPDDHAPDGRANAQIRAASVVLPKGVTLSAAAVAGLESCSDAQFGAGTGTAPACPAASRIGSVELVTSALRAPMTGGVYMGQGVPGERFRLFVAASGPGAEVALVGGLATNQATGQITVSLADLPQLPFERMTMSFRGGSRAPLVTPLECGPLVTTARFDSHGVATRAVSSTSELNGGGSSCPRTIPFKPTFDAGAPQVDAGKAATPAITVRRQDGEQVLDKFSAMLPLGMSPVLGAVESCGSPDIAKGTCPASSRLGSVVAEVGSGSEPAILHGDIFLTGPYRGAPFGVALTFRALFGSFDMGTFVVRGALQMDSRSAQATIETASLPRIAEGLPIRFRTVGLDFDRPGFILNPTSCAAESFKASIVSANGTKADAVAPFEVRNCDKLEFRPAISMALRGAEKQLRSHGKPGLRLGLRSPRGSINLRDVEIPLPRRLKFDPHALDGICGRPAAAAGECPASSAVGSAVATTTLLPGQMKGSIYIVQPRDKGLPDLWVDLDARGLELMVQSETSVREGHLTTHLAQMPDVAFSGLKLNFNGGSDGIFTLRRSLCGRGAPKKMISRVAFEGQNGAFRFVKANLQRPSCAAPAPRGAHDR